MRAVPPAARAYILCAVVAAGACVAPAVRAGAATPWAAVALLAALYAGCEQLTRHPVLGRGAPTGMGAFVPVLLAGAFLLPPAAAALVAVPGALAGRVEQPPVSLRKVWHAAQFALATGAAAWVFGGAGVTGGGARAVAGADPYALLPAAAAAVAFCLVLAVLDAGILVTAERRPPRTAWRGLLLRSLAPHLVHGLAGLMMAVLWRSPYGPFAALLVLLPMYVSCWVFAQYHRERTAHQATIRALVQAVDLKDRYTRGHSERVGRASVMIARELGMDDHRLEVLRFAGILHDVGKLGVPTRLLRKDGPLTPEERRVIELHPEYGHEMVRGIGFLGEARAAILHHHERLDGRGYPYGLRGEQIPECARVVAVADAFDAMTSTRSYRRARPVETAVAELRRCAGAQFDARMVRALAGAIARHGWHPAATADAPSADPVPHAAVAGRTHVATVPAAGTADARERAAAVAGQAPTPRGNVPPRSVATVPPDPGPSRTGADGLPPPDGAAGGVRAGAARDTMGKAVPSGTSRPADPAGEAGRTTRDAALDGGPARNAAAHGSGDAAAPRSGPDPVPGTTRRRGSVASPVATAASAAAATQAVAGAGPRAAWGGADPVAGSVADPVTARGAEPDAGGPTSTAADDATGAGADAPAPAPAPEPRGNVPAADSGTPARPPLPAVPSAARQAGTAARAPVSTQRGQAAAKPRLPASGAPEPGQPSKDTGGHA